MPSTRETVMNNWFLDFWLNRAETIAPESQNHIEMTIEALFQNKMYKPKGQEVWPKDTSIGIFLKQKAGGGVVAD